MAGRIIAMLFILGSLVGIGVTLSMAIAEHSTGPLPVTLFFVIFMATSIAGWRSQLREEAAQRTRKAQDYAWYKAQHPDCCASNRVQCHECKSDRISVQRLMNRTYYRAHVCAQCGTTLYYSPEVGTVSTPSAV